METTKEMGICRFCGQYFEVGWVREIDPERFGLVEADYIASRSCRCAEARKFCDAEEARERRVQQREMTLASADTVIDELFGEAAKEAGEMPMSANSRSIIRELAEMVYDCDLQKAAVTDCNGITAKITRSAKGNLRISRSESNNVTQEVI